MNLEEALVFRVNGVPLVGVLHRPPGSASPVGLVVVVGGPQYRVGSHRQFVLLARCLARAGIVVLRFDLTGMGDSGGDPATFETADLDVAGALDILMATCREVRCVVLWGLCDGASAALMYAARDPRVSGLVLLNPWVRTPAGLARAHLRGHYLQRLFSRAYWQKVLRDPATLIASVRGLGRDVAAAQAMHDAEPLPGATPAPSPGSFLGRMLEGARRFQGPVLVLLAGRDLTAAEFKTLLATHRVWRRAFSRRAVRSLELADADHTFSSQSRRDWVADRTLEFVRAIAAAR